MNSKRNYDFILSILGIVFLIISLIILSEDLNFYDFLIAMLSIFLFAIGTYDLISNKPTPINIFLISYYFGLYLSRYKLSQLQMSFSFFELVFLLIFPLVFIYGLKITLKLRFRIKKIKLLNLKNIQTFILIIYILVNLYIFSVKGVLLFKDNIISARTSYSIPNFSLFNQLLFYSFLTLITFDKRDKIITSKIGFIIIFLFEGVFKFSRGNIFRLIVFAILLYLITGRIKFKLNFKTFTIVFITIIFIIFSFGLLGQVRYEDNYDFNTFSKTNITNEYLDWIYTYIAPNYDIASINLRKKAPLNFPYSTLYPILHSVNLDKLLISEETHLNSKPISKLGYTSGTFIRKYIVDFGVFYFIELFFLGLVIGFFYNYSTKYNLTGLQALILTGIIFSFFMNLFIITPVIYSLVFVLLINKISY